MKTGKIKNVDLPDEVDFGKGVRGQHHIPPGTKVLLPAAIEESVWEHFSDKAKQRRMDLSELLTAVLQQTSKSKR